MNPKAVDARDRTKDEGTKLEGVLATEHPHPNIYPPTTS